MFIKEIYVTLRVIRYNFKTELGSGNEIFWIPLFLLHNINVYKINKNNQKKETLQSPKEEIGKGETTLSRNIGKEITLWKEYKEYRILQN